MADYLTQYYLRIQLVTSNLVAFWIKSTADTIRMDTGLE